MTFFKTLQWKHFPDHQSIVAIIHDKKARRRSTAVDVGTIEEWGFVDGAEIAVVIKRVRRDARAGNQGINAAFSMANIRDCIDILTTMKGPQQRSYFRELVTFANTRQQNGIFNQRLLTNPPSNYTSIINTDNNTIITNHHHHHHQHKQQHHHHHRY